jgi:hypothetical protein
MTTLRQELILVSDAYAAARGLSRARVSTIVFNAGGALDRIVAGKDLTTGNFERAMRWFSDNWPDNAVWPDKVERPAPSPSEAA